MYIHTLYLLICSYTEIQTSSHGHLHMYICMYVHTYTLSTAHMYSAHTVHEDLMQQLVETKSELLRRQQQAFEVCDRLCKALMEWARTKDVRFLLAAQQDITAVQNDEGDTCVAEFY